MATKLKDDGIFSISKFKSQVGTLARPNYFLAKLDGYKGKPFFSGMDVDDTFKFRCEKAELPGRTLATNEDTGGGGTTLKLPYDVTYNDVQLSIICAEDMTERVFFETWIDLIINPAGYETTSATYNPGLVAYHDNYSKGIQLNVTQLDSNGRALITYTLWDVYPVSLTPMNATWEETNTYQRFGVTLTYRYHTIGRPGLDSSE